MFLSLSQAFEEATHGPWITTEPDIQWKIVTQCLFFKYTNSESDWRYDFKFWPTKDNILGWGHAGFQYLWNKVKTSIISALKDRPPLFIAGFSMGGALATNAHIFFAKKYHQNPTTFAFGAPKSQFLPSNKTNLFCCDSLYNIYTINDPVHYLAPSLLGYRHVGRQVPLPRGNLLQVGHDPDLYRKILLEKEAFSVSI